MAHYGRTLTAMAKVLYPLEDATMSTAELVRCVAIHNKTRAGVENQKSWTFDIDDFYGSLDQSECLEAVVSTTAKTHGKDFLYS